MPESIEKTAFLDLSAHGEEYYRELQHKNVLRLLLTYLAPLILLSVYFYFQYHAILEESGRNHLKTVVENHARTIDLFLRERVVNLSNLIDDPKLAIPPGPAAMEDLLQKLKRASDTFVDAGFLNAGGVQEAYEGPFPQLAGKDYSRESWFQALRNKQDNFIITDIYPGIRGKPHFTIAVCRILDGRYVVLRTSLDPERFYRYLSSLTDMGEVAVAVVNAAGTYQIAAPEIRADSDRSAIVPPAIPRMDTATALVGGKEARYAYAWLRTCDWALIGLPSAAVGGTFARNSQINIIAFSIAIILLIFSVIVIRAKKIVQTIRQADTTRARLSDNLMHASKLAAVGELASGIAHEINNPLAIINEEVGLIQDLTDPKFNPHGSPPDIQPHLKSIQGAVFRCRDITRKLLEFVRKGEIRLQPYHLHALIDGVVDSFYEREMAVSNLEFRRNYCQADPCIMADKTQLEQVFLNLINNAIDASEGGGCITITTTLAQDGGVRIDVSDTGIGMTEEQLQKIFIPFYTTKQVGKGTGLGLSISYAIIRNLGGEISVESLPYRGTTFSINLPSCIPAQDDSTVSAGGSSVS